MSDHLHSYRDNNLRLYQVNNSYSLLLQLYPLTFSYAVIYKNRLFAWGEDCDLKLLNEPDDEHDLLSFDYKNVVCGLPATGFTLIPNLLFSTDKVADVARFLDVKPNEKVFAQPFDDDNHIIYKIDEKVVATSEKYGLQKAIYIHKGWVSAVAANNPNDYNIYVNITKTQAAFLYFTGGKVRFYNTFEFNNPDELAYYASFVAKELRLQPKQISLILSGDIDMGDKNAAVLSQFFNGVELDHKQLLELPAEIGSHHILSLAALSLCASSEVF